MAIRSPNEGLIRKQFASLRGRARTAGEEAQRQAKLAGERRAAIQGGPTGATGREEQKAIQNLLRITGEAEGQIGGAEAGALQQARELEAARQFTVGRQEAAQKFARAERLGSQDFATQQAAAQREFATQQSALQREQAERLFNQELVFKRDSFMSQLSFQFAELEESRRANFFNAAALLKESGLKDQGDWVDLLRGTPLGTAQASAFGGTGVRFNFGGRSGVLGGTGVPPEQRAIRG